MRLVCLVPGNFVPHVSESESESVLCITRAIVPLQDNEPTAVSVTATMPLSVARCQIFRFHLFTSSSYHLLEACCQEIRRYFSHMNNVAARWSLDGRPRGMLRARTCGGSQNSKCLERLPLKVTRACQDVLSKPLGSHEFASFTCYRRHVARCSPLRNTHPMCVQ